MNKKALTLIEVMVAIALILVATGSLGWKMYGMIAKKRFTTNIERLRSRLLTCRRLAMNMQSDWQGVLSCDGTEARLSSYCADDERVAHLPTLTLGSTEIFLNGEKMTKMLFDFTSSGDIHPQGKLQIRSGHLEPVEWDLISLFSVEEGRKAGPAHPNDWYK